MRTFNEELPTRSEQIAVRLLPEERAAVLDRARAEKRSVGDLVREALKMYLTTKARRAA